MSLPKVEVVTDGVRAKVMIDNIDISDKVCSYKIQQIGGSLPTISLELIPDKMTVNGAMIPDLPEVYRDYYELIKDEEVERSVS